MIVEQTLAQIVSRSVFPQKGIQRIAGMMILMISLGFSFGCSPAGSPPVEIFETNTSTPLPATLTATATPTETPSPALTETATPTPTFTSTPEATLTPSITPYPTLIVDEHGAAMVLVPAGEFLMGSDSWSGSEQPAHTVYLDSYYIDQFEVTNLAFAAFLNQVGNQIEGVAGKAHWVEADDPDLRIHHVDGTWQVDPGRENHPMNEVTWFGARAFCEWRQARLPSEAEWEKAARGTDGRTYPWGEQEPTCEMANFAGCQYDSVPVDRFPDWVSPYGAYNMAGNVHEWTNDWYSPDYYGNSPTKNPTGPENGDYKVFRGASWFNGNFQTRTTYRYPKLPVLTYMANGFRCAKSIDG